MQFLIADAVDSKGIAGITDNLGGVLHEHLRIIQEILSSAAFLKMFFKLPPRFKVDTPIGTYNPDWAVYVEIDFIKKEEIGRFSLFHI